MPAAKSAKTAQQKKSGKGANKSGKDNAGKANQTGVSQPKKRQAEHKKPATAKATLDQGAAARARSLRKRFPNAQIPKALSRPDYKQLSKKLEG